ncbi:MAG: sigma-54-dependent Fis family transcriptional regulator [Opitutales bacterium]|nr:sigma-54-dependent Fis family transcriptional regulator [Opitutales bacterium]
MSSKRARAVLDAEATAFAEAVGRLVYANPFLPERIRWEREALGAAYKDRPEPWNLTLSPGDDPNVSALRERAAQLLEALRKDGRRPPGERARRAVGHVVLFHLFHRFSADMDRLTEDALQGRATARPTGVLYRRFAAEFERQRSVAGAVLEAEEDTPHLFACFFQVRRAYRHIASSLVGRSPAMARLRAGIWQSIFTHDLHRYRRSMFSRMGDMATLVTGPTGTGKELVARAIGLSRYIPFDAGKGRFAEDFAEGFFPLNLSALTPTLIESELFGHRKGAFTGAWTDREGWLEACPAHGSVFLDEIGELDGAIQVKLLRVLQARTFHRIGDSTSRRFPGKLIAATNRDLRREVESGRFREDFYYRLCSDRVETPPLAEQLRDDPAELDHLLRFLARRVAGEGDVDELADEAARWIRNHLGAAYAWPGNFRELEQCVRNIAIRGDYRPLAAGGGTVEDGDDIHGFREGSLSMEAMQRAYCRRVYRAAGSYGAAAHRLGVDRRTVRRYVEEP